MLPIDSAIITGSIASGDEMRLRNASEDIFFLLLYTLRQLFSVAKGSVVSLDESLLHFAVKDVGLLISLSSSYLACLRGWPSFVTSEYVPATIHELLRALRVSHMSGHTRVKFDHVHT